MDEQKPEPGEDAPQNFSPDEIEAKRQKMAASRTDARMRVLKSLSEGDLSFLDKIKAEAEAGSPDARKMYDSLLADFIEFGGKLSDLPHSEN